MAGVHAPLPDDAEEVEDPLTDMLSKSATDPWPDPGGGGGGDGSGGPPATITGATAGSTGFATAGSTGFAIGVGVGMVVPATLACATGATAWVTGGAGTNGAGTGGGGKGYGGGGTPIRIGVHYGRWRKVYLWGVWNRVCHLT